MERQLIRDYETQVEEILAHLSPGNLDTAVALAELPEEIRGFGHVKKRHADVVRDRWQKLRQSFLGPELSSTPGS